MDLFLYSTNTYLSHIIAKNYYNGRFYVWCSPVFQPPLDPLDKYHKIPRSSSPYDIYMDLKRDVESGDLHSAKIEANKLGLKKGALEAAKNQWIDENELARINYTIDNASLTDFKPILYIIPLSLVKEKLEAVPVSEMANPLSTEYRIKELLYHEFEMIHQF